MEHTAEKKEKYVQLEVEVIEFMHDDIITVSLPPIGGGGSGTNPGIPQIPH